MFDQQDALDTLSGAIEYNPVSRGFSDVEKVLAYIEGENDGPDYAWVVQFKDGETGVYFGGCDCTGWDCQSSLELLTMQQAAEALPKGYLEILEHQMAAS